MLAWLLQEQAQRHGKLQIGIPAKNQFLVEVTRHIDSYEVSAAVLRTGSVPTQDDLTREIQVVRS